MSKAAVDRLVGEVNELINYIRKEYEMSYAEAIGALRLVIRDLEDEAIEDRDESTDGG